MKYTLLALLSLSLISCQPKFDLSLQDAEFEAFVKASLVEDVKALEERQKRDFHIDLVSCDNCRAWDDEYWAADSTFKITFKGKVLNFTVTQLFNLDKDLKIDYDTIVSENESFAKYEEEVNRWMLQVTFNLI